MSVVLLALRLLLAGVFGVAGAAKLADRAGSVRAVRDFGLPAPFAPTVGSLLPIAELGVGVLLLPQQTAWWGALGALALLLAFLVGMGYNLARGRAPDCHCFGQIHSEPVSWRSMARNAVLAVCASAFLYLGHTHPGASLFGWISGLSMAERILLTLVALLAIALVGICALALQLLKQHGRLLGRLEALEGLVEPHGAAHASPTSTEAQVGLAVGASAPCFQLSNLADEVFTLDALRARGKPVVLVFGDAHCGPCNALLPDIARFQQEYSTKVTIALVTRGARDANEAKAKQYGLDVVLLQVTNEVAVAYNVRGTPSAVLIRKDGRIGSALAEGGEDIRKLIASVASAPSFVPIPMAKGAAHSAKNLPSSLQVPFALPNALLQPNAFVPHRGGAAPLLRLPDLDGVEHELSEFRGRETVALFWNPQCGFCQRMLPDLKAWESAPALDAPQLVIVTTGDLEANRALGLRSVMLHDAAFTTGADFGVFGTPTGIMIDAHGNIAAEPAIGGNAVMGLLRAKQPIS